MTSLSPQEGDPSQIPQALLLTGEGLNSLYGERLDELYKIFGELGLRLTVISDLNAELLRKIEAEPKPISATRDDMMTFAVENGYTRLRAGRTWLRIGFTESSQNDDHYKGFAELPPIRYLGRKHSKDEAVDVRSLHDRLVASDYRSDAWIDMTIDSLRFLSFFVVSKLAQVEELGGLRRD